MANKEQLPDGLAEDAASEGGAAVAPKSKKKLIIIGAAAAVLAIGGGGGAYMMLGTPTAGAEGHDEAGAEDGHGEEDGEHGAAKFVDMPPMTVNLRTADGSARFLKVHLMLVPGKAAQDAITAKLPIIVDRFQPFLRELRPEDLAGSAATFRVKEEMLIRANAALGAGAIRDVLIQDLIQQ